MTLFCEHNFFDSRKLREFADLEYFLLKYRKKLSLQKRQYMYIYHNCHPATKCSVCIKSAISMQEVYCKFA